MSLEKAAYVSLKGELDIARVPEVAAALPDPAVVDSVVINCVRATYIDSLVMGMLVQFRRDFIKAGGDPRNLIMVLPTSGPIRKAFEITGLARLFSIAHAPQDEESGAGPRASEGRCEPESLG